jgi:uncharacterized glyoxalase superfamily protein PhnB
MAKITKLSPVLRVRSVDEVLPFWEERLGFERTVEIPDGEGIGFAILVQDGIEVMLQSERSAAGDMPTLAAPASPGSTALFLEVASLEPFLAKLQPGDHAAPIRETFYGTREAIVRDPAGHLVVLAQKI